MSEHSEITAAILGGIVGGFLGFFATVWQRFVDGEDKAEAAREFWKAMCDILLQTVKSNAQWLGQGDDGYAKYFQTVAKPGKRHLGNDADNCGRPLRPYS